MKHPTSRQMFSYWAEIRGDAPAPDRSCFDPGAIRGIVADTFVLTADPERGFPVRTLGSRVGALLVRSAADESFVTIARGPELGDILAIVTEENLPVCAGLSGSSRDGAPVRLELLLLPFANRLHSPPCIGGSLAAFGDVPGYAAADLQVTSWRVIPVDGGPARAIRKLTVASGLTVYEGIRRTG